MKRILITTLSVVLLFSLSACNTNKDKANVNDSNDNYKEAYSHFSDAENEKSITSDISDDDKVFVAKGKTTLMNFLSNAEINGYDIVEPDRNGSYVTAKAKNEKSDFDIRYLVEEQKVYMVEISADNDGKNSPEYKQCILGLSKSLNPDMQSDLLNQTIEKALSVPYESVINNDTLFVFDEEKAVFTITH